MKTGLLFTMLLGAAEVPALDIATLIPKLTAMAALIFLVVWREVKTLPSINKTWAETIKSLFDRQHEDSVETNKTLTELRENCAATRKD